MEPKGCGQDIIDRYFEGKLLTDDNDVSYCFWSGFNKQELVRISARGFLRAFPCAKTRISREFLCLYRNNFAPIKTAEFVANKGKSPETIAVSGPCLWSACPNLNPCPITTEQVACTHNCAIFSSF